MNPKLSVPSEVHKRYSNTALTQTENYLLPALTACIYFFACVCNQKHAENFLFAMPGEIPSDLKVNCLARDRKLMLAE